MTHEDASVPDDDPRQSAEAGGAEAGGLPTADAEASGHDDEHAHDETWHALEQMVLDMRKRSAKRNGRLQDALSASLDNLAVDAASLATDGGMGERPWEAEAAPRNGHAPREAAAAAEVWAPASEAAVAADDEAPAAEASAPAAEATVAADDAPAAEVIAPASEVIAASPDADEYPVPLDDWASPADEWSDEDQQDEEAQVDTEERDASAELAPMSESQQELSAAIQELMEMSPVAEAPPSPTWVPPEQPEMPAPVDVAPESVAWVEAAPELAATDEGSPLPISVIEPLPSPVPDAGPASPPEWRAGASRTNPVPPETTETRPPWAPAVAPVTAYASTAPAPPPASAPAQPEPGRTDDAEGSDPADQVARILEGLRAQSSNKPADKPAPAGFTDPLWFPEEKEGSHAAAQSASPTWLLGGAAALVILISAIVTYMLLHG